MSIALPQAFNSLSESHIQSRVGRERSPVQALHFLHLQHLNVNEEFHFDDNLCEFLKQDRQRRFGETTPKPKKNRDRKNWGISTQRKVQKRLNILLRDLGAVPHP